MTGFVKDKINVVDQRPGFRIGIETPAYKHEVDKEECFYNGEVRNVHGVKTIACIQGGIRVSVLLELKYESSEHEVIYLMYYPTQW